MNIPKTLKIKKRRWKIIFTDDKRKLDTGKYNGMCVHDDREILIDPKLTGNDREETFWHELLHAVWPDNITSNRREELIVHTIAERLQPVMRQLQKLNAKPRAQLTKQYKKHRRIKK